jgi:predicted nucleic-acid-binding protein
MISLDTNVLVRILVADDPKQTRRAVALLEQLDSRAEKAHVSDVVLCELVWVLGRGYGHDRQKIAVTLRHLVAARQLVFDSPDRILHALRAYEHGKGSFADYLIRQHAKAAGCDTVVTFDKQLLKEEMFTAP